MVVDHKKIMSSFKTNVTEVHHKTLQTIITNNVYRCGKKPRKPKTHKKKER